MRKKIVFLTGTRADYGKIKPMLKVIHDSKEFRSLVFVTGMHLQERFGNTYKEVLRDGLGKIFCDDDYCDDRRMDVAVSNAIRNFSRFVRRKKPDMVVVHGDRLEALAGAIVGGFNNILVAHIEGGEVSGTIDESIRHGVSKFAQLHFVANKEAKRRLVQLGELENKIFVIGSPDVDVMLSEDLPSLEQVRERYGILFPKFGILLYHPVVTEIEQVPEQASTVVNALKASGHNYVGIYPNNDRGHEYIRRAYEKVSAHDAFQFFPSMRFEHFLSLLKSAQFIIGNSSAGIREACVYGTPAVDIGSRQQARYDPKVLKNVIHVEHDEQEILEAIARAAQHRYSCTHFGAGGSAEAFYQILCTGEIWDTPWQKCFVDIDF